MDKLNTKWIVCYDTALAFYSFKGNAYLKEWKILFDNEELIYSL